jgi:NAD(P)-dependent dehydrogenase (short-subunit alcohol dehydrogenase family)/putative sterol carrier protein
MSLLANTGKLAGRTVYISGASRGIGRDIALKLAKDKANIIIAAKTAEPHPKLKGTIFTVAEEVEAAGGKAFPCVVDIRDEAQVKSSVEQGVAKFGGIDIVVNNASAISLTKTPDTDMKRYDLMHSINSRGTFLVTKTCLPYLKKGTNPHILNLSPPLSLKPQWFANNVAYTIAKYNMSLFAFGWAEELRSDGIAVNCLWPATAIYTAAMEMLGGGGIQTKCRKPEIMSDAAYAILSRDSKSSTGYFFIDEHVLQEEGIKDMTPYAYDKNESLMPDFFLENTNTVHSSQYMISGNAGGAPSPPPSSAASSSAPASESSGGGSGILEIMQKIEGLLTPELVKSTNAVFQFDVKGADEGQYFLDMKSGKGTVGKGAPPVKTDVTISVSGDDFIKLFNGKLSPTSAYMMGKMKIKGDMSKAMALDKLLAKLKKSKL